MRFSTAVFTSLLLAVIPAFAAPAATAALHEVEAYRGTKNGQFIVKLKEGVSRADIIKKLGLKVTSEWDTILNGFAGLF